MQRRFSIREWKKMETLWLISDIIPVGVFSLDGEIFGDLYIHPSHQGRGYGKAATKLILDMLKQDGRYRKVVLCYIEGNEAAKKLYESFGFVETERDEDEIIMELDLCAYEFNTAIGV